MSDSETGSSVPLNVNEAEGVEILEMLDVKTRSTGASNEVVRRYIEILRDEEPALTERMRDIGSVAKG